MYWEKAKEEQEREGGLISTVFQVLIGKITRFQDNVDFSSFQK